jgi:hypothetical protein
VNVALKLKPKKNEQCPVPRSADALFFDLVVSEVNSDSDRDHFPLQSHRHRTPPWQPQLVLEKVRVSIHSTVTHARMIILTVIPLWMVLVLAFESWSPKPRALARGSPTLAAALSEQVPDGRNYSNFSEQQRLDAEISLPAHSVCEKQEKKKKKKKIFSHAFFFFLRFFFVTCAACHRRRCVLRGRLCDTRSRRSQQEDSLLLVALLD